MYAIILFIFINIFSGVHSYMYLYCNQNQTSYFENEMKMFGVDSSQSPFDYKSFSNSNITYFPTSCITENNRTEYPYFTQFLFSHMINVEQPLTLSNYIPNKWFNSATNAIWHIMGYNLESHNNELYWHYRNNNTDNIVVFFHGINAMNGLENLYLLNQLKVNASIYVSLYPSTFITEHLYNNTYSQHVNNVVSFLQTKSPEHTSLIGNSYGSIRITTLCKRYNCINMKHIILTDPVNINLPFSSLFKHVIHGAFTKTKYTGIYRQSTTVNVLRQYKHYYHLYNNVDWYEWSLDSHFMEYYKENLVLVIGKYDSMMNINTRSNALLETCRILYTNTLHGFVIFTNFFKKIK
jgi:hypothetical protein